MLLLYAFVVDLRKIICSLESFLFLTCDKMNTSCLHCACTVAVQPSLKLWSGFHFPWRSCIFPCLPASIQHPGTSKHNSHKHLVRGMREISPVSLLPLDPLLQDDGDVFGYRSSLCSGSITLQDLGKNLSHNWEQVTHKLFRIIHPQWNAFSQMRKKICVIFNNTALYSVDIVYSKVTIWIYTK